MLSQWTNRLPIPPTMLKILPRRYALPLDRYCALRMEELGIPDEVPRGVLDRGEFFVQPLSAGRTLHARA